jgi:hypothetical protein
MFKRIYSYAVIVAASLAVLVSCKDDDDKIERYTSNIDVSGSEVLMDNQYTGSTKYKSEDIRYDMDLMFSTDGGETFTDWPALSPGQSYKVKVVQRQTDGKPGSFVYDASGHRLLEKEVDGSNCFDVDWSASSPAPKSVNAGIAEFVMSSSNKLLAKVTDTDYTQFVPSKWVGDWFGQEKSVCCNSKDDINIRQDATDPNKFIMTNFFGDGDAVEVYFVFTPSTNAGDQVVTVPTQTTSEGGVAEGSGTYDQCTNTFVMDVTYDFGGGSVYAWNYSFTKQ